MKILSKLGYIIIIAISGFYALWQFIVLVAYGFVDVHVLVFIETFFDLIVSTYFIFVGIKGLKNGS